MPPCPGGHRTLVSPYNPLVPDPINRLKGPSWAHLFGTDSLGRDILSRVIYGSRISIVIGLIAVSISLIPGTLLGLLAGFYGRRLDEPIMRFMDIMLAFPAILLAIFITAILGPSLLNTMIAVGIVYIPHYARIVRSAVLSLKEQEFVQAVRSIGGTQPPDHCPAYPSQYHPADHRLCNAGDGNGRASGGCPRVLGAWGPAPTPEWGAMLSEGRQYIQNAPHVAAFPGLAILTLVLGFNLFGDGLRDVLDPSLR